MPRGWSAEEPIASSSDRELERTQQRQIAVHPLHQPAPVNLLDRTCEHIEHIDPVATLALEHIEFDADQFFRRNGRKEPTPQPERSRTFKPWVIDQHPVIRQRPNHIKNHVFLEPAENPAAIVILALKIILKPGASQCVNRPFVISRPHDHIHVLGVAPASGVNSQREGAMHQTRNSIRLERCDAKRKHTPLFLGNKFAPRRLDAFRRGG